MKKQEQRQINEYVEQAFDRFVTYIDKCLPVSSADKKQLRSCSAKTYTVGHYVILQSYATPVAFIDKSTGELFDVLRLVYGYTATSAQHIAKFAQDFHHTQTFTYKQV